MTTTPDHSGKLISQVAHGDAGLKHEPTRKRDNKRRSAPRRKPTPQPEQPQEMEDENV